VVVPDLSHHHGSGVHPDPNPETTDPPVAFESQSKIRGCGDDIQRRGAGPPGVVLVRQRRPEEREDAVAHQSGQGAAVSVNGWHQRGEGGVHHLHDLFGIASLEHGGRTGNVEKEHRYHAA
jgi:hypothetical protein